ncbi:MAG: diacylglycerol/lipid kinase family protein [Alloalcanivorax venustensis]
MNITVIYNPTAGGGRERRLRHFVRALEEGGGKVRLYHTRAPGDATRYLRGLADQGEVVVAAGGDGTTNDVINGLEGDDVIVTISGGNVDAPVFARALESLT